MRTAVLRFLGERWYAAVLFVLTAAMIVFLLAIGLLPHARQNSTSTHEPPGPMEPSQKNFRTGAVCDPAREVRGLWIPSVLNITYPSKPGLSSDELKAELDALLESARSMNLNTLCLQVRPASDALYHSALFPTSAYLSGKQGEAADGDFDALAYLCEIAAQAEPPVAVYAWVNPLRVTSAGQDPGELSPDNPAVLHPDWTVSYNGALYYNAAIPGVRDLIAAGVKEICDNYPVAGVIFDDYFSPYPVNGQNGSLLPFDDAGAYQTMGGGMTLDDFRRSNVNQMVKACYDAVHESSLTMRFGIAPFGIWQNNDGKNGGSDTAGMSSYSAIYCDPLAWMEGGYVDFIAPQLYWTFATSVARYDTLVRWWNAQCDRTGTDLWIAHATYRYDIWNTPGEMRNQIAFARSEISYRGSLFYGYPGLRDNTLGITDEIRAMFEDNIFYYSGDKEPADCAPLVVTTPENNSRCDDDGVFLLGQSDPASSVTLDGVPLSRTRNGYFSVYKTLHPGENTFVFRQGDTDTVFTLWNGQYPPGTEAVSAEEPEDSETALLPLAVKSVSPAANVPTAVHGKETVTLSVSAEEGCNISVETPWDHRIYTLISDAGKPTVDGTAVYSVDVTLPEAEPGTLLSLGTPVYTVSRSSDHAELTFPGGPVYAVGDGAKIPVEVTKDDTDLKTARNSWYYDDYAPAMRGMRVNAERISDGYAELQFVHTAYLDASCIRVLENEVLPVSASIGKISMERSEDGRNYLIHIPTDSPVPTNCIKDGMTFTILLYQSQSDETGFAMPENPLFSSVRVENRERRCAVV
ncbi:MAG: family 10 glycosylhydrolase, partial [Clostridia bacterium]|nr:family 10 glycosylhydrolase [Clostridia bacterium]